MAEIKHKVLNSPESILAHYLREMNKYPPLSYEEEQELAAKVQAGDPKALEKLLRHNFRFVFKIAKKYIGQGVPFLDLIEVGNLGLLNSARKYRPNPETKFVSYAVWGIKHAIYQELTEMSNTFRIPSKVKMKMFKMTKELEEGKLLNRDDLLMYVNLSPTISLDAPLLDSDGKSSTESLLDRIACEQNENDEAICTKEISSILETELKRLLNENELYVIREYFGIESGSPRILEDIGDTLGVSRERIRAIKEKALRKLSCSEIVRKYFREHGAAL